MKTERFKVEMGFHQGSSLFFKSVCSPDGQTDRWGQTVVSLDYDVCSQHYDLQ